MASPIQLLIWTALPTGRPDSHHLSLTASMSPLLFNEGPKELELGAYTDFVNWPQTVSSPAVTFEVKVGTNAPVPATIVTDPSYLPDPTRWPAVFGKTTTYVLDRGQQEPVNTTNIASFDVKGTYGQVESIWQTFGVNNPNFPPTLIGGSNGQLNLPPGSKSQSAIDMIRGSLAAGKSGPDVRQSDLSKAVGYYMRNQSEASQDFTPEVPIFDFHQGISALGHYERLVRLFGLAFDLEIPLPSNYQSGLSTIRVIPTWQSNYTGTTYNVSPPTACLLTSSTFFAAPAAGSTDYENGMLNLADATRFSVTELDVDGAAQQVYAVASSFSSVQSYQENLGSLGQDETYSFSLPTLRSTGPKIVWTGFANDLVTQIENQNTYLDKIATYVANPTKHSPPTFHAPDLIQGHRIDVLPVDDPNPQWMTLHRRAGDYTFGPLAGTGEQAAQYAALEIDDVIDEGFVGPGVSQPVNPSPPDPNLYIHEEIARWNGWSLSAPRIGGALDPGDGFDSQPHQEAVPNEDSNGNTNPQMAANFSVVPYLPKLRFGHRYQFRARGVDIACNSVPAGSQDATTATPLFTYRRYQPVLPPVMVGTDVSPPGQGSLTLVLLNYGLGQTPDPVSRWVFPPRVSQLLAEEHGAFDGFALGSSPDLNDGVDPSQLAYWVISSLDEGQIQTITNTPLSDLPDNAGTPQPPANPISVLDPASGAYYVPSDYSSMQTPWMADPLSSGAAWLGLPGSQFSRTEVDYWGGDSWPQVFAELFTLAAGDPASQPATTYTAGDAAASAVRTLTLPPGAVMRLHLSSSILDPQVMGVYQWILANPPVGEAALYEQFAYNGQLWQLSPYLTITVAHATRQPQDPPTFVELTAVKRNLGQTTVDLYDTAFFIDEPSTSSIDVGAVWTDPVDNPSDSSQDPGPTSPTATMTTTADAFKVQVPDPDPEVAFDNPGFMVDAPSVFALTQSPGVTHDIGDTKHHLVSYTATGTSRFAEFFRPQRPIPPTQYQSAGQTVTVTDDLIGLNAPSVDITWLVPIPDTSENETVVLQQGDNADYSVDELNGTVTFNNATYVNEDLYIDYEPRVTSSGEPFPIHILASSPPAMPKIDRIMPAFALAQSGKVSTGHLFFAREGGWLRVWLDRPWWSSGANEMLGVVALPNKEINTSPLTVAQSKLATQVGLDPISVADASLRVTTSPMQMGSWTPAPLDVPGITYNSPPVCPLIEDTSNKYTIYPYPVQYDETNGQWFADVQIAFPGLQLPPPGYFVRLGLVRFQPYAYVGAQVSKVSLATFAQPVVDRVVSVVKSGPQTVRVSVTGPAYQGFRPLTAEDAGATTIQDLDNDFAIREYTDLGGQPVTSTMVVDIQIQDPAGTGLPGELSWTVASSPVVLSPTYEATIATWTGTVTLPYPIGDATPMRARVSELDYYTGSSAPAAVDTSLRRSFVAHIPIT
ncbi:MAG: hypothetical protein ACLPQS_11120 [Acidimicrobiales bacterium]